MFLLFNFFYKNRLLFVCTVFYMGLMYWHVLEIGMLFRDKYFKILINDLDYIIYYKYLYLEFTCLHNYTFIIVMETRK